MVVDPLVLILLIVRIVRVSQCVVWENDIYIPVMLWR